MRKLSAAIAAIMLAALAGSATRADPLARYRAGDYELAVAEGTKANTAFGYAVAARAVLAEGMMRSPCLECLTRAADLARRSIAIDPKQADAHVFLAVAIGYQARIVGTLRARLNSYPEEAKRQIDAALQSDPRNALALAALGGWNIQIVRDGGAILARWLYGATLAEGFKAFAAAFDAAPGNVTLRYQFALSLGGFDAKTYRSQVRDALSRAANGRPQTAYEKFAQARANELLDALNKDDGARFDRLIRRDQGYPGY